MLPDDDIRRLAIVLRMTGVVQMDLHELIRSIQFQIGRMPCFSEVWSAPCSDNGCPFSAACTSHLHIRCAVRH